MKPAVQQVVTQMVPQRTSSMYLKATLVFEQPLTHFFYYLNGDKSFFIGKISDKVLIFNTITKQKDYVEVGTKDFVLSHDLPPYIFVVMRDRWMDAFRVDDKGLGVEQVASIRISKLEPRTIARYNKGYYIGGYNRSSLPGNRRSTKRSIYYTTQLKLQGKNKPEEQIYLKDSQQPVSLIQVQTPYMLVYCHPIAYLMAINSKQILITFEKDAVKLTLIEGRYAVSNVNGIGISSRNILFGFDVERFPLFGVEITDHKEAECQHFCMERTGRIFCGFKNLVYEYLILKKQIRKIVMYGQDEQIVGINCTPSNNLMILKQKQKSLSLDVFVIQ